MINPENKKAVIELSQTINVTDQISLATRKLNLLSIKLLEYDYYRRLPEDRKTKEGYEERLISVKSAAKQALRENAIILERLRILDDVDTEGWKTIRKKYKKIRGENVMSQQIINIPVNWDDEIFTRVIEKGVVEEVKNEISKKSLEKLGIDTYYGYSDMFERIVKECVKKVIDENKDEIIEEIIKRGYKSLVTSKAYRQAKDDLLKGETE